MEPLSCEHDPHNRTETDLSLSRILPDINTYQNRKSYGTVMMDFALLVTNVNQIQHIIKNFSRENPVFCVGLFLVSLSILLQIIAGICLAINCRYNVKNCDDICKADRLNNWIMVLIFLITAINVVIPTLGIPEFKSVWDYVIAAVYEASKRSRIKRAINNSNTEYMDCILDISMWTLSRWTYSVSPPLVRLFRASCMCGMWAMSHYHHRFLSRLLLLRSTQILSLHIAWSELRKFTFSAVGW